MADQGAGISVPALPHLGIPGGRADKLTDEQRMRPSAPPNTIRRSLFHRPATMTTPTSREQPVTATAPLLFLSHRSSDRDLASQLCSLLEKAGLVDHPGQIFFSEKGGIRNGDSFTKVITQRLHEVRLVVALLTPAALRRSSVIAEMAVARLPLVDLPAVEAPASGDVPKQDEHKLRVLAVPAAIGQGGWPFDSMEVTDATDATALLTFLKQLAGELGRAQPGEDLDAECKRFAQAASQWRYRGAPRWLRRAWPALAGGVGTACLLWATQAAGDWLERVSEDRLDLRETKDLDGVPVTLAYVETFPLKVLGARLFEAHERTGLRTATARQIADAFASAMHDGRRDYDLLGDARLARMQELALSWNGKRGATAGENRSCAELRALLPLDGDWCDALEGRTASTRSDDDFVDHPVRKRFDNARFAILKVGGGDTVRVVGVAEGSRLDIGAGYKVHRIHAGERGAVELVGASRWHNASRWISARWAALTCGGCAQAQAARPSPAALDPVRTCDASAWVPMGGGHFALASDESNSLLRFEAGSGSLRPLLPLDPWVEAQARKRGGYREIDLEAAARIEGRVYWAGSHGNDKEGEAEPSRHRLIATQLLGQGAQARLEVVGRPYKDLLQPLLQDKGPVGLALTAAARAAHLKGGVDIEGLADSGRRTLIVGFRSPLIQGRALLVELKNPVEVTEKQHPPLFGAPMLLDLGGHGVRDMARDATTGDIYILSGPADARVEPGLWRWTPDAAAAERVALALPSRVAWESLAFDPSDGSLLLGADDSETGTPPCKARPLAERSFSTHRLPLR